MGQFLFFYSFSIFNRIFNSVVSLYFLLFNLSAFSCLSVSFLLGLSMVDFISLVLIVFQFLDDLVFS